MIATENKKRIIIITIGIIVGFSLGIMVGSYFTMYWGVQLGMNFLELKGIELDIDADELAYGVYQYKNRISSCYSDMEGVWLNYTRTDEAIVNRPK